jgi:DNA-binding XRE family transcriptional regulator
MATRQRAIDRADEETRRTIATIGREIREARRAAGLSQTSIGRKVGLSHTHVSRVERGLVPSASVWVLGRMCRTVGLELAVRAYPGGDPIRDIAQVRLLERFRARLHPGLRWRTEVPLPIPGDRRAWDAVIGGAGWSLPVEAETRVTDAQALVRRIGLKARDGGFERVTLVLADTRANRAALQAARVEFEQAFPIKQAVVLHALGRGDDPGHSGIVLL